MHSILTKHSGNQIESFDGLLASVLDDQQHLTAVERFAAWHDRSELNHSDLEAQPTYDKANHYSSLMPATAPGVGEQYAFEVDLDACSGCKACVVACHNLNGLESDETWRKVGWLTSHQSVLPIVQHVTTACHHCVEPGCLSGCPVQAYEKDPLTGIVRHLDDQCFGCKYCTMMCPYEVPQYSATLGIVRKCDMCSQRIGHGEAPACVQACPNEAIRIKLVRTMEVREQCATPSTTLLPTAPPSHLTLPTTSFLSKRILSDEGLSLARQEESTKERHVLLSKEAIVDHPHEGHLPLVGMLVSTQASVGMWCVLSFWMWNTARTPSEFALLTTVAAGIGIVGVHLALAHLGRPWLAFRAFLGWRTSWLSREAIVFGLYMGVTALASLAWVARMIGVQTPEAITYGSRTSAILSETNWTQWLADVPMVLNAAERLSPFANLLTVLSAFVGAIAVACSVMIYVATCRKLWNLTRTTIEFTATTLGLGLACVSVFNQGPANGLTLLMAASVAGLGLAAKAYDRWRARPGVSFSELDWQDFSKRSGRLLNGELSYAWTATWMSWLSSVLFAIVLCFNILPIAFVAIGTVLTLVMLASSQFLNRWLYFTSIVTYRMPGASS